MQTTIRRARPADAAQIAAVHVEGWREGYRGMLPDAFLDSISEAGREMTWREQLSDPAPRSAIFVAEADEIVGFSACGPYRHDDIEQHDAGEIYALYVDPDYWREGLGTELARRTIEFLREESFDLATLWVLESNDGAREFYEKAGFFPDGSEKTEMHKGVELELIRYRGAVD